LLVTFLLVVSVTLVLAHARSIPLLPAQSAAVLIFIAALLGLLIGLFLAYLADYRDLYFHTSVQVVRELRVPFVVAIPKRPS
jgi:capsular polysaccharide biosynthesis protein